MPAFFVHLFAVVSNEYNGKLPETSQLHVLWRKCCMCSCSLFFHCRSFLISPWWQLAFPLFLTAAIKRFCSSSNEILSPLIFISRSISFFVIQVNVDTEIKSKERVGTCCCCFCLYIGREAMGFTAEINARLLEMQNFVPSYMKGWTYERTYPLRTIFSEPKFLGCID